MTPDEIYNLLDKAIETAKAKGLTLIHGSFGDGITSCCAISALPTLDLSHLESTANDLGITEDDLWAITAGFDNARSFNAFSKVGERLRAKHAPIYFWTWHESRI